MPRMLQRRGPEGLRTASRDLPPQLSDLSSKARFLPEALPPALLGFGLQLLLQPLPKRRAGVASGKGLLGARGRGP